MQSIIDEVGSNDACARKHTAFTLIELIIVIGVIALLVGLLLPVAAKARSHARSAACLSNLRQWSVAFKSYNYDNQQSFGDWNGATTGGNLCWLGVLAPYLGGETIMFCPEATDPAPLIRGGGWGSANLAWWAPEPSFLGPYHGSYGFNAFLHDTKGYGGPLDTLVKYAAKSDYYDKITRVSDSTNTPAFCDCAWCEIAPTSTAGYPMGQDVTNDPPASMADPYKLWRASGIYPPQISKCAMSRHPNISVNVAFVDGSARNIPVTELWSLQWGPNFIPNSSLNANSTASTVVTMSEFHP